MMRPSLRCFLFAALVCGWVVLAYSQPKKLWQVYAEAGETAFQYGRQSTAEIMLLSAIKEAESDGVQDSRLGKITYELGLLYSSYKSYGKAEGYFLAALRMWEQCHEPDTDEIAKCLNALGLSLASQGRQKEAERPYRRAINICEKLKESSGVAIVVINLSSTYCAQDKCSEAEKCVKEGLEFVEQSKKADDETVASLVETLVMIHLAQNRFDEAEAAYRRLLSIGEAGKVYAERLEQTGRRAGDLYEAKRYPEAEGLLKGELALLKKQSALTTLAAANAFNDLADVHYRQRNFKEAETEKKQLIEIAKNLIAKKVLDPDFRTDWAQADLALIQYAQSHGANAEPLFQEALDSMRKRRGKSKSAEDQDKLGKQIADRLEQLAELYDAEGKSEQSASVYKEALQLRESKPGKLDAKTIATSKEYVKVLRKLKRDAEAHEIEARLSQVPK
jgi:tetratricopeptide (TPR) repeat protein